MGRVDDDSASRAAITFFRSAVYFHQGFFRSPSMNRTAAMNLSSRQGSCRWLVMLHRASYNW
jgi:hypothetical protein